jgi:hypothetical protein
VCEHRDSRLSDFIDARKGTANEQSLRSDDYCLNKTVHVRTKVCNNPRHRINRRKTLRGYAIHCPQVTAKVQRRLIHCIGGTFGPFALDPVSGSLLWDAARSNHGSQGAIDILRAKDGVLYVSNANRLYRVNSSGQVLGDPAVFPSFIRSLLFAGPSDSSQSERLYVAGGGTAPVSGYVLAVDANTNQLIPGWNVMPDRPAYELDEHDDNLLLGGAFTSVGTVPQSGFARFAAAPQAVLP